MGVNLEIERLAVFALFVLFSMRGLSLRIVPLAYVRPLSHEWTCQVKDCAVAQATCNDLHPGQFLHGAGIN